MSNSSWTRESSGESSEGSRAGGTRLRGRQARQSHGSIDKSNNPHSEGTDFGPESEEISTPGIHSEAEAAADTSKEAGIPARSGRNPKTATDAPMSDTEEPCTSGATEHKQAPTPHPSPSGGSRASVVGEPKVIKKGDQVITSYVDEKTGKITVYEPGIKLEVSDYAGKWYPAKVVEVDGDDKEILVHFENWSSRFDEWIKMDSNRLRPSPNTNIVKTQFKVGECVEALWNTDGQKYPGVIQSVLPNDYYQVLFDDGIKLKKKYNQVFKLKPVTRNIARTSTSTKSTSKLLSRPLPELTPISHLISSSANKAQMVSGDAPAPPPPPLMSKPRLKAIRKSMSKAEAVAEVPSIEPTDTEPSPPPPLLIAQEEQVTPVAVPYTNVFAQIETDLGKRKRTVHDYSALLRTQIRLPPEAWETPPNRRRSRKRVSPDAALETGHLAQTIEPSNEEEASVSLVEAVPKAGSPQKRLSSATRKHTFQRAALPSKAVQMQEPDQSVEEDAPMDVADLVPKFSSPQKRPSLATKRHTFQRSRAVVQQAPPEDVPMTPTNEEGSIVEKSQEVPALLTKRPRKATEKALALLASAEEYIPPKRIQRRRTLTRRPFAARKKVVTVEGDQSPAHVQPEAPVGEAATLTEGTQLAMEPSCSSTEVLVKTVNEKEKEIVAASELSSEITQESSSKALEGANIVPVPIVPTTKRRARRPLSLTPRFDVSMESSGDAPLSKRKRTIHDYSMLLKTRPKFFFDIEEETKRPNRLSCPKRPKKPFQSEFGTELLSPEGVPETGEKLETRDEASIEGLGAEPKDPLAGTSKRPNRRSSVALTSQKSSLTPEVSVITDDQAKPIMKDFRIMPPDIQVVSTRTTDSNETSGASIILPVNRPGSPGPRSRLSVSTRRQSQAQAQADDEKGTSEETSSRASSSERSNTPLLGSALSHINVSTNDDEEELLDIEYSCASVPGLAPSTSVPADEPKPVSAPPANSKPRSLLKRPRSTSRGWWKKKSASAAKRNRDKATAMALARVKQRAAAAVQPKEPPQPGRILSGLSSGRIKQIRKTLVETGVRKFIEGKPAFKDVSVDIINCWCGLTDEHGLMIQCEFCLCWQHGQCYSIETVEDMPPNYVCESCQNPDNLRPSMSTNWSYKFHKAGRAPSLRCAPKLSPEKTKVLTETNDLMDRTYQVRELLHTSRMHIQILQTKPDHKKLYQWDKPHPTIKEQNQEKQFNKVHRPLLRRLLYINRDKPKYAEELRARIESMLKQRNFTPKLDQVSGPSTKLTYGETTPSPNSNKEHNNSTKQTIQLGGIAPIDSDSGSAASESKVEDPFTSQGITSGGMSNDLNSSPNEASVILSVVSGMVSCVESGNISAGIGSTEKLSLVSSQIERPSVIRQVSLNGEVSGSRSAVVPGAITGGLLPLESVTRTVITPLSVPDTKPEPDFGPSQPGSVLQVILSSTSSDDVKMIAEICSGAPKVEPSDLLSGPMNTYPAKELPPNSAEMDMSTTISNPELLMNLDPSDPKFTTMAEDLVKSCCEEPEELIKTLEDLANLTDNDGTALEGNASDIAGGLETNDSVSSLGCNDSDLINFMDDEFIYALDSGFDSKDSPDVKSSSSQQFISPGPPTLTRITPEMCRENLTLTILDEQKVVNEQLTEIEAKIIELEKLQNLGPATSLTRAHRVEALHRKVKRMTKSLRLMRGVRHQAAAEFYRRRKARLGPILRPIRDDDEETESDDDQEDSDEDEEDSESEEVDDEEMEEEEEPEEYEDEEDLEGEEGDYYEDEEEYYGEEYYEDGEGEEYYEDGEEYGEEYGEEGEEGYENEPEVDENEEGEGEEEYDDSACEGEELEEGQGEGEDGEVEGSEAEGSESPSEEDEEIEDQEEVDADSDEDDDGDADSDSEDDEETESDSDEVDGTDTESENGLA